MFGDIYQKKKKRIGGIALETIKHHLKICFHKVHVVLNKKLRGACAM